jgi:hypothetical protein
MEHANLSQDARQQFILSGLLWFLSVVCLLIATNLNSRIMGNAALGIAVFAPQRGSPEWNAKTRLRRWADGLTYASGVFAVGGVIFQTIAALAGP